MELAEGIRPHLDALDDVDREEASKLVTALMEFAAKRRSKRRK